MDSNLTYENFLFRHFRILQSELINAKECSHIKIRCVEHINKGLRTVTYYSFKRWVNKLLSMQYPSLESYGLFLKIYDDYENKRLLNQYSYSVYHLSTPGGDISPNPFGVSDTEEDFFLF